MKKPFLSGVKPDALVRDCSAFLWVLLLAVADGLVSEMFNHKVFTTGFADFWRFLSQYPLAMLVNILIVLVTLAPALFLRHRKFWCTLVSAIWLIGGGVNGFILLYRMTPFTTADLTVLNTGLDTLPNYMSKGYIALLAGALALLAGSLIYLLVRGKKSAQPLRHRLVSGVLALLISGGALAGCWNAAFKIGQLTDVFSNLGAAYENYGFSYCFLQTWLNKGIRQPNGYSAADMARIQKMVADDTKTSAKPQTDVNVVFVQLESFIDPAEITTLKLSQDAVPNWTELSKNFTTGYLQVPVVGAGTANTECEVLTGMSTRMFGPGEYPYKTRLVDHTVESVAYDLAQNGYATHAIHNHRATFYSRNEVFPNLGFDDFTSLEYMPAVNRTARGWAKDYILTYEINKALDVTPDQPDLVFTVSVQGHGSYPTAQVLKTPAVTVESCSDENEHYAIEYYVNQVHEMDTFIGNLVKTLSARQEKTVLVLYGDHLPSLGLSQSEMASGSLFKTRYLIWNNFGLPKEDQDLYAYQLSASVLGKLGITTGTMNSFQQFCQKETTYRTDLRKIQYDVLYGKDYLSGGSTLYKSVDMKMGMEPITVTGLTQRDDGWYVYGENFSPYCKVTVNGKEMDTTYVSTRVLKLNKEPESTDLKDIGIAVVDQHKEVLSDTE